MTTTTPVRSADQRLAAIARANEIRFARSRLKHAIRAGDTQLAILLIRDPTPIVRTMAVLDLLRAIRGLRGHGGNATGGRALRLLARSGISPAKKLGGLTERQRQALCDELEAWLS